MKDDRANVNGFHNGLRGREQGQEGAVTVLAEEGPAEPVEPPPGEAAPPKKKTPAKSRPKNGTGGKRPKKTATKVVGKARPLERTTRKKETAEPPLEVAAALPPPDEPPVPREPISLPIIGPACIILPVARPVEMAEEATITVKTPAPETEGDPVAAEQEQEVAPAEMPKATEPPPVSKEEAAAFISKVQAEEKKVRVKLSRRVGWDGDAALCSMARWFRAFVVGILIFLYLLLLSGLFLWKNPDMVRRKFFPETIGVKIPAVAPADVTAVNQYPT